MATPPLPQHPNLGNIATLFNVTGSTLARQESYLGTSGGVDRSCVLAAVGGRVLAGSARMIGASVPPGRTD